MWIDSYLASRQFDPLFRYAVAGNLHANLRYENARRGMKGRLDCSAEQDWAPSYVSYARTSLHALSRIRVNLYCSSNNSESSKLIPAREKRAPAENSVRNLLYSLMFILSVLRGLCVMQGIGRL